MQKLKLSIAIKIKKNICRCQNKQAKQNKNTREKEIKIYDMKSKQASKTNDCACRNCGINQGSYAKNQMSWQWPPVNTTRRKRHEKK